MASTLDLLKILANHDVDFVGGGGVAGVLHGSRLVTQDVDVCAPLTLENLTRILASLAGLNPRFRAVPDDWPLPADPAALFGYRNLYLVTDLGQLDVLSEITGVGSYVEVASHAITVDLAGTGCRVLDLDTLIRAKRALNLPKDRQAIVELEAIRERISGSRL